MRTCLSAVTAIAVCLFAAQAQAGHFCGHCGCQRDCKKVCRLECKKKESKKIEYACESEDFCVPGPSKRCGYLVDEKCQGHPHREFIWQPKCAKVYTRKKLVKNEVTKEVPDYKWVVEEYCCVCGHYIKVEDKDKSDNKSGDKGPGKNGGAGDSYQKSEWPPVLLSGAGRADEIGVGDGRGYYWGDARRDGAARQSWPPVIGGGPPAGARFSWAEEERTSTR